MIYQETKLGESAVLYSYILDHEISYNTYRKWPAVIICPGGGYLITATKEGESAAMKFLSEGFHCFVLRYSTWVRDRSTLEINEDAHFPSQERDLLEALHFIHSKADEWHIDTGNIFINAYSAGCHVAMMGILKDDDERFYEGLSFMPSEEERKIRGLILGYPMISADLKDYMMKTRDELGSIVSQLPMIFDCLFGHDEPSEEELSKLRAISYLKKDSPPMFIWQTLEDVVVDPAVCTAFVAEAINKGVPCEYHLFAKGPHGLCMADENYAKSVGETCDEVRPWFSMAITWMKDQMV